MATRRWSELEKKHFTPKQLAKLDRELQAELLEMSLKELRQMAGKTQAELSKAGEFTQGELSRAESRKDHRLSTLRRYVEGLGGELEVVARLGNKRITLLGV